MSTHKNLLVPKIGQRVYIKRKNSLGQTLYFEGQVTRIRVEVKCSQGGFMTVTSPHLIEKTAKGLVVTGKGMEELF